MKKEQSAKMGADQVNKIKESITLGEKNRRKGVGKNPFLVPKRPQGGKKHKCLRTGKKYQDGLRWSRAEELVRQAGVRK